MTAVEALDHVKLAARRLRRWEMGVDGGIHAVAIAAGIAGSTILLIKAAANDTPADIVAVAVYSFCLLAMFISSAAYNLGRFTRHGRWLRNLDQAGIFLMIAGTYTPFTVLSLPGLWGIAFTVIVWSAAILGIAFRLLPGALFDRVSVALYLILGWMALFLVVPLLQVLDGRTLVLLAAGGGLYTLGIVFHLWERLPFQTAIWHMFVVAAAALHFAAVATSLAVA